MLANEQYTPQEVLQIIVAVYLLQEAYDPTVLSGQQLTSDTTISDYIDISDLLPPKPLARYFHKLFELPNPPIELEEILAEDESTLGHLCNYIAQHAAKEIIMPITLLGQSCDTAAIFKKLITNLQKRGVKTGKIKPSSLLIPLFKQYGGIITEEVNKMAPGALSKFEYTNNFLVRTGQTLTIVTIFSLIIVPLIWQFHWSLLMPLTLGLTLIFTSRLFKPEKEIIENYVTIRDLIVGIQLKLSKSPY
jgi:hypothetical protein